jgi:hypothetical protein
MSKAPKWPERRFELGKTEDGHRRSILVDPMNPYGPVNEELQFDGGGSSQTRVPPDQQMGWLLIYYLPFVAEVIHETNELVREILLDARAVSRSFSRLAFWRRRT